MQGTNPAVPKWAAAVFGVLMTAAPFLPARYAAIPTVIASLAGWFGIHTASKTSE
jgi:hypothetical protein